MNSNGTSRNDAWLYDYLANTWSSAGAMAHAHSIHGAILLNNGKVLVVGGGSASGTSFTNTCELYDPATGSWSPAASMASNRGGVRAVHLKDDRVAVFGGQDDFSYLSTVEIYTPATNTWTTAAPMSLPRIDPIAVPLLNGKVLVAGGFDGSSRLAAAELYDPATNSWSQAASMHSGRYSATGNLLRDGRVLVIGGNNSSDTTNNAEIYDPAANTWTLLNDAGSIAADECSAVQLVDGKVATFGGTNNPGVYLNRTGLYDLAADIPDSRRPQVYSLAMQQAGAGVKVVVTGKGFQGDSEASSGTFSSQSASNFPLLLLQRVDNDQLYYAPADTSSQWSDTAFTSAALTNMPKGYYRASIIVNGIPSAAKMVKLEAGFNTSVIDGLVAYYPFNGNANDASGNGNNGTVNGAALTTDRLGKANSAYSFDGINDFIQLGTATLPLGNADRSISAWVKFSQKGSAQDFYGNAEYTILSYGNTAGFQTFGARYGYEGGSGLGFMGFNDGGPNADYWTHVLVNFDEWHLITYTYSGNSVSIYKDTVLAGSYTVDPIGKTNFHLERGIKIFQNTSAIIALLS